MVVPITPAEIDAVHEKLESKYRISGEKTSANPTLSQSLEEIFNGIDKEDDVYDQAADVFQVITNPPLYEEGNYATAWISVCLFLSKQEEAQLDTSVFDVAHHVLQFTSRYGNNELAEWLRTGDINMGLMEKEF